MNGGLIVNICIENLRLLYINEFGGGFIEADARVILGVSLFFWLNIWSIESNVSGQIYINS